MARSTAALAPEITTWPPPLSLAASTTSALPVSGFVAAAAQISCARSISAPKSAAMAPVPGGVAFCMASPRRRKSFAAVAISKAPAAVSALYSPSECPATSATRAASPKPPSASSARTTARECAISAGWALAVSVNSSCGPSHISLLSFWPRASSTSWRTWRAEGKASARSRPMPTAWLPWPGKTKAKAMIRIP